MQGLTEGSDRFHPKTPPLSFSIKNLKQELKNQEGVSTTLYIMEKGKVFTSMVQVSPSP